MVRTKATSLSFIVLAAFAALSGARADYPHPRPTATFCEEAPPLDGLGGTRSRDCIIGGDGTTGPTFPSVCRQAATIQGIDGGLAPHWRG